MSERTWLDQPNRARHHQTLREAFVALTESHPELASYMCPSCAEAFLRGDEHPAGVDALFFCMTEDSRPRMRPNVLGPILTQFFIFTAYKPSHHASRRSASRHGERRER